jgi:UDPglucose--hexose-1-phosphate uridylyltransferase
LNSFELSAQPHRRLNPLTREWVLVSPHRTQRPWQGALETAAAHERPAYDPGCYLCPGNARAGGIRNPAYRSTYVFENDFAALKPDSANLHLDVGGKGLLVAEGEPGLCRVMCFSPRHDLTLSTMQVSEVEQVVTSWRSQFRELSGMPGVRHVQIFENRGEMMGASNPHPHCQIWATASIPEAAARELDSQTDYFRGRHNCLLCDYIELENTQRGRLVFENRGFAVLVPFWAVWPFETLLVSRRHLGSFPELEPAEISELSAALKALVATYDRVFEVPFPYSMGFHQSPTDGRKHPEWHLHAHFYPPLLRSATVRKFMVGFEMLGTPQRDITPERAAERLRSLAEIQSQAHLP